jgi:hypothetical protein
MNDNMERITADRLRIVVDNEKTKPGARPGKSARKPKPKPKRRFAQIPLDWLGDPTWRKEIPPALRLYLVLQYATRRGTHTVRLTNDLLAEAGIARPHKGRYLGVLEARRLVAVARDGNRNPQISLLK